MAPAAAANSEVPATAVATAYPPAITPTPQTTMEPQVGSPFDGTLVGGIVVGVVAGVSLFLMALYILFRHLQDRSNDRRIRGLLPGRRVPTGGSVPRSAFRGEEFERRYPSAGSDRYGITNGTLVAGRDSRPYSFGKSTLVPSLPTTCHTSTPEPVTSKNDSRHVRDLEANYEQDIGLQYFSESRCSRPTVTPLEEVGKAVTSKDGNGDYAVSPFDTPPRHLHDPLFPSWPKEDDDSIYPSRRSSLHNWPLVTDTVSSPALLERAQEQVQRPPVISPFSPLSPFADFETVMEEAEMEQAEKERHRHEAYKKLSGVDEDSKTPGSVARAREYMPAAQEASKTPGNIVNRSRQNLVAVRDYCPEWESDDAENEADVEPEPESDMEVNETGTVVRRRNQRAC